MNYDYSVFSFEPFDEIVDTWNNNELFEENGEENTIAFYFCLGTHGDTETGKREKHENFIITEKLFKNTPGLHIRNSTGRKRRISKYFECWSISKCKNYGNVAIYDI